MACRKVNGKSKKQLMNKFFVEAFLTSILMHFPHILCKFINFHIFRMRDEVSSLNLELKYVRSS